MTTLTKTLREQAPFISAGVLSANLMFLADEIAALEKNGIRMLHFDVMDGHFAPLLTFGPPFIKAVKTSLLKDVHLIIDNPLESLKEYVESGADIITIHADSSRHVHETLKRLGSMANVNDPLRGIVRGIALNPSTPVCSIEPVLDMVDMVTLVAVNPGFGGQKFIENTIGRFAEVRKIVRDAGRDILLCIDGGVNRASIETVASLKADIVVSGSALFENKALTENIKFFNESIRLQ
jgi:ribulose-phosphate 3-epimerase